MRERVCCTGLSTTMLGEMPVLFWRDFGFGGVSQIERESAPEEFSQLDSHLTPSSHNIASFTSN